MLPRKARAALGYTLIEVLAAAAVVAVSMTGAVALSSTLMLQEEYAWRVAVTRNYQENMIRLWQIGLSTAEVAALMPGQKDNVLLNGIINGTPYIIETGVTNPSGLGTMQAAAVTASVNISQDPRVEQQGAVFTLTGYRPTLPASLRPPRP